MATVDDSSNHGRDSTTELNPPPPKKAKTEEPPPPGSFWYKGRLILKGQWDDLECRRQRDLFYQQLKDSEGFDVDWDSFDYVFNVFNFDWDPDIDAEKSSEELIEPLIKAAMEDHDQNYGTKLEFDKYVSANLVSCRGILFYITFSAKDVISSNQDSKLYQAKVLYFGDEVSVVMVRLKPTQSPSS